MKVNTSTRNSSVDVMVIGSGFAGCILAWILARQGRSVALVDQSTHPRFAIGESSTPIADMILRRLGQQYDLPELNQLSTWGTWKQSHREIRCGRKRGFSYFVHHDGQPLQESPLGAQSLLVAASPSDELADTHWFRADVDHYLFTKATEAGALDLTGHRVTRIYRDSNRLWSTIAVAASSESGGNDNQPNTNGEENHEIRSNWIIDASGPAGVTGQLLGGRNLINQLKTSTHSIYGHFQGVRRLTPYLADQGWDISLDPFDADDAAQHHLIDPGWIWMLRFDHGVTSVGYTVATDQPLQWPNVPTIDHLMSEAAAVDPPGRWIRTGRLQRFWDPIVDNRCVMLPTSAVSIDPLHSTGIAHALAGVQRIAPIILQNEATEQAIGDYRKSIMDEARFLDLLVHTAYQTISDFPRFTVACMLYFAGAIACEERYQQGDMPSRLWNCDDPAFADLVSQASQFLHETKGNVLPWSQIHWLTKALQPWNSAGLLNPQSGNRYAYTVKGEG